MSAVVLGSGFGWAMTREDGAASSEAGQLLKKHAAVMGRVAMALLGDAAQVEQVLERVAREAASKRVPDDSRPVAWLLGLVRTASAMHLSKLPLQRRTGSDVEPSTARMGAGLVATQVRASLASLKPTEREAVVLAIVGGLEAKDVAAACNVDVDTAKTRIARGLEQLMLGEARTALLTVGSEKGGDQ